MCTPRFTPHARPIRERLLRAACKPLALGSALTLISLPLPVAGAAATPEFCSPTSFAPADLTAVKSESVRRLAERLRQIASEGHPFKNPYRSFETVELLREVFAQSGETEQTEKLHVPYANALLRSGEPELALQEFNRFERLMRQKGITLAPTIAVMLETSKALCHLRLGEQENCVLDHNAESCLFPIQGRGVHQLPRGSRAAISTLGPMLEKFPNDLRARWLLNIAHMTLDQYPSQVPAPWLIDPKLFASDHDIKRFPDVAGALGLDVNDLAGGIVMDDFDNDGFLDLMMSAWHTHSPLRVFRNHGDGTFTERTTEAGLVGVTGGLNLIQADYNNDGFVDVLVLRGAWLGKDGHVPNSLLRNNGDGTFSEVTEEAGLLSFHPTQTAAWFDYDGDSHIDLFIGNESEDGDANPCELYRNNGDGTFTECGAKAGVAVVGFVKGVLAGDYNNDGRPDLFLSRLDGSNNLLRNDGPTAGQPPTSWRFTDVAKEAGVTQPYRSFSCWFWDYDNDGWLDLMVTGYAIQDAGDIAADYLNLPHAAERVRLFRNRGDGTFADVTRDTGLFKLLHTMGCNFGDLDNDGWLDFYAGTGDPDFGTLIPNRMFRNDGARTFQDVTTSGGFGQLQKGHGIAFGDIDNDGDQDIYSVVGGAVEADLYHNQLFANPGHGNRWLKLQLEGVHSSRDARGARIKLVVKTPAGERALYRTVGSGSSFGASPLRQEIGLGDATEIVRTEIFWPSTGVTQVVPALQIDRSYTIREGASVAVAANLRSFRLPSGGDTNAHPTHSHAGMLTPPPVVAAHR